MQQALAGCSSSGCQCWVAGESGVASTERAEQSEQQQRGDSLQHRPLSPVEQLGRLYLLRRLLCRDVLLQ